MSNDTGIAAEVEKLLNPGWKDGERKSRFAIVIAEPADEDPEGFRVRMQTNLAPDLALDLLRHFLTLEHETIAEGKSPLT